MLSLPDFTEKNIIISFATQGQRIAFKNDNLLITDTDENILLQATCHKIFSLWIIGSTTITSGILERSKKFGFSVYLLSHSHKPYGLWNSATEGNFLLRKKQYEFNDLSIARHIVCNKISNQTQLLQSIRNKEASLTGAIELMKEYQLQSAAADNLQTLLGIEGVSTRLYFGKWFSDLPWKGRKPRAKTDPVNTTLDIGYTHLFHIIECMLNLYGFDIYQGVYHRCFYQRKSLVCDLVEPFRCIMDRQIKRAYGLKQMQEDDFIEKKGQYFLKIEKNKDYTRWLIQSILDHKAEIFTYVQEYYRAFIRNKPIEEYPIFNIKE